MSQEADIRDDLSAYLDGELPQERVRQVAAAAGEDAALGQDLRRLGAVRGLVRRLERIPASGDFAQRLLAEAERRGLPAATAGRWGTWPGRLAAAAVLLIGLAVAATISMSASLRKPGAHPGLAFRGQGDSFAPGGPPGRAADAGGEEGLDRDVLMALARFPFAEEAGAKALGPPAAPLAPARPAVEKTAEPVAAVPGPAKPEGVSGVLAANALAGRADRRRHRLEVDGRTVTVEQMDLEVADVPAAARDLEIVLTGAGVPALVRRPAPASRPAGAAKRLAEPAKPPAESRPVVRFYKALEVEPDRAVYVVADRPARLVQVASALEDVRLRQREVLANAASRTGTVAAALGGRALGAAGRDERASQGVPPSPPAGPATALRPAATQPGEYVAAAIARREAAKQHPDAQAAPATAQATPATAQAAPTTAQDRPASAAQLVRAAPFEPALVGTPPPVEMGVLVITLRRIAADPPALYPNEDAPPTQPAATQARP